MTKQSHTLFIDSIDPSKTFPENWSALRSLEGLYLPVGYDGELGIDPANSEALRDYLDRPGVFAQQNYRVQLLFTDPTRADEKTTVERVDAFTALHRSFRSKGCEGILFNPPGENQDVPDPYTMHIWGVPRLCGLLKCSSPSATWEEHLEHAQAYARENQIYAAHYHIVEAREMGAPIHRSFQLEYDTLLTLGLYEQAQSFFQWFSGQCQKPEMLTLPQANLMTLCGQADQALALIKPLLIKSSMDPDVWLERGRALFRLDRAAEAVKAFTQCLERRENDVDAMLGLGVATRALHYESENREGLLEAASWFEKVADKDGYYRAECLHHLGTIHLALEEFETAENCFSQAIEAAPSAVSRRNLALVLHAQGKIEQGEVQARFLKQYHPNEAQGLEKYYSLGAQGGTTIVVHTSPSPDELQTYSRDALKRLKALKVTMKDDLMDFRRLDGYINYYAPSGTFLQSSELSKLSEEERGQALLDLAMHLSGVLVREKLAEWVPAASGSVQDTAVRFIEGVTSGTELMLYSSVLRRLAAGSASDNLTNLDFLTSTFPNYMELHRSYQDPFVTFAVESEKIASLKARAGRALLVMKQLGLPLNGDTNDLRQIDLAITSFFDEQSAIRQAVSENKFTDESIEDLGIYLGFLIQKFAGGVWHDHPDVQGLSLKQMSIQDIYPVTKVTQLFLAGAPADAISSLVGLEAPLALAQLTKKVNEQEITSRKELSEALSNALPSVMLEDPTGASLSRMVDMISAMSDVAPLD